MKGETISGNGNEKGPLFEFQKTTPEGIYEYLENEWDRQVHIIIAQDHGNLIVPEPWHGAGAKGDVEVLFGDVLTEPLAGTELSSKIFAHWLQEKGFVFENDHTVRTPQEVKEILLSDKVGKEGEPIIRFVREKGTSMILEFYHGSCSPSVLELSRIGNQDVITPDERLEYINNVFSLMSGFIGKGIREAKKRLEVIGNHILRKYDDCSASYATIAADICYDEYNGIRPDVREIGVSIATLQSLVVAIYLAEKYNTPTIIRVGAPAFALGNAQQSALNYMMNTQEEKKLYHIEGNFKSGDFGKNMCDGSEQHVNPHFELYGHESIDTLAWCTTRVYFNGGGAIAKIMAALYARKEKPFKGILEVLRAKRIDNGEKQWGVILAGAYIRNQIRDLERLASQPKNDLITLFDKG